MLSHWLAKIDDMHVFGVPLKNVLLLAVACGVVTGIIIGVMVGSSIVSAV